jgi:hypothetical protein
MNGYADTFLQRRAISKNMNDHMENDGATYESWSSRFNATRDLFEQAQEEEMSKWYKGEL